MTKKLNVYLMTYNRSNYLRIAIDSILQQSYSNFNLYIFDNASTDDTYYVVSSFNDKRINYYCHNQNIGGIENINYAFKKADSEYFIALHDDDILERDLFQKEIEYLNSNLECCAVSCLCNYINANGVVFDSQKNVNQIQIFNKNKYFLNYIKKGETLIFPATMYRTSFIRENNLYLNKKVGPCCDVILHSDIEKCGGSLAILNCKLFNYRKHDGQDSLINAVPMLLNLYKYIISNEYYNKILHSEPYLLISKYKNISHTIIHYYINNKVSYNESKDCLLTLDSIFRVNAFYNLVYVTILNIIRIVKYFNFIGI